MERYKALFTYTIFQDEVRDQMKELLGQYLFESLDDQSTYGLSLDVYQVRVQQARACLQKFCRENFIAGDNAYFYESRMNQHRNLSAIIRTNLLEDE